jgi:D-apionolactonase
MPTDWELLHGVNAPPVEGRWVHAGPVEALLSQGDLRYVRRGKTELARRIQVAVRSADWGTVAGVRSGERLEQTADTFHVSFDSAHRHGELEFRWRCTIDGAADGTITYTMEGEADRDFAYRRIGLCVLHPSEVFAGATFEAGSPAARTAGELPRLVGPQLFDGDGFPPLFDAFDRLRMTGPGGVEVEFAFEGDVFEMEDQRNWTDASFKSYSQNPLARVEPWHLEAGARLRQRVTISSRGGAPANAGRLTVTLGDRVAGRVPAVGVGLGAIPPGEREIEMLHELRLGHLRVDLHLETGSWREELDRGRELARALGCGLELAVFVREDRGLDDLRDRLGSDADPAIARVLVYGVGAEVTPGALVSHAREVLGPTVGDAPIGGGTDVYFAELNREQAFPPSFDVIAYPITPQVHSDDDVSLVETPIAQADTVVRARRLAPHASVAVTPITLKPRFNPDAPDVSAPAAPGTLPDNVDTRQMALITAAWTLASIRRLGEAGASSATYFETVGWRGLLETDPLPPRDAPFPSAAGMIFPVYHLLAQLAPLSGLELLECHSSDPLAVQAVQIAAGAETVLALVANLTPHRSAVELGPIGADAAIRRLNTDTVRRHMYATDGLRDRWDALGTRAGEALELDLSGYEISVLRWRAPAGSPSGATS